MTHKLTIYESRSTRDISSKLAFLEKTYLEARKKKLPSDLLLMGVLGTREKPVYQINASFKSDQRDIVEFLISQLEETSKE